MQKERDGSLVLAWSVASVFLVVGLTVLGLLGKSVWEACLMNDAVQVEGRLLSVELGSSNSRRRSTHVLYRYEFGGEIHQSGRLALFKQTGSFFEPLKSDLEHNRPILVWVDPDHPQRAFLDREFVPWPFAGGLAFSLGWSSMGFYLMMWAWRASRNDSRETILRRSRQRNR